MKKAVGSALILLGAMSFYALGRWGGAAAGEAPEVLAPLLGTAGSAPLLGIILSGLLLGTGMFVLGVPAEAPATAGPRVRSVQAIAGLNALLVLGCLLAVTFGVSAGWAPRTIAVFIALAVVEVAAGLIIAPLHLRSGGPRSVSGFSLGALLLGAVWTGSVILLGMGGV